LFSSFAFAVPQTISYSGRLLQNGKLANGNKTMTFRIWTLASGGVTLSEQTATLPVYNGIYSVDLGLIDPNLFSSGASVYLETTVGGETLLPRTKLNSNIFAMQSGGLSADTGVTINAGSGNIIASANLFTNTSGMMIGNIATSNIPAGVVGVLRWNANATPSPQLELWDGTGWVGVSQ
jgi:hypothetical protein